ncbi:MAG: TM2 domain-containing protein [Holophagales bacterium]|jgi:TM2 domain-containing membrane protein YozV|nr:TM2 domain-containing protein [Holophagales bacterium]
MSETETPRDSQRDKKSKVVAAIFAFFLGCYGIHHFYLGSVKKGVVYLCISLLYLTVCLILTFFLGLGCILLPLLPLWSLIEFIIGLTTSDSNFDAKYN